MSGIAFVIHLNQIPVDRGSLFQMAQAMQRRGPDYRRVQTLKHAGMAYAALNTTPESLNETQPYSVDGNLWIVADARLDNRDDLHQYFSAEGIAINRDAGDAEYILRAYERWQEDCVEHLLGDFAFAIWDETSHSLFCARDHFGMRQLHWYRDPHRLVVATDIAAIHAIPEIPQTINEARIADFLVTQLEGRDKTSTLFKDIYRLPAGHVLLFRNGQQQIKQYWRLEAPEPLTLKSDEAYAEAYFEAFREAVDCRLRSISPDDVGIMMSGGLDSTSLASMAAMIREQNNSSPIKTFSGALDETSDDEETRLIRLMSQQPGIDATIVQPEAIDEHLAEMRELLRTTNNLFTSNMEIPHLIYANAKRNGIRIMMDGAGADNVVSISEWYIGYLLRSRRFVAAARETIGTGQFWGAPRYYFLRLLWQQLRLACFPRLSLLLSRIRHGDRPLKESISRTMISDTFADEQNLVDGLNQLKRSLLVSYRKSHNEEQLVWLNHPYTSVGVERYDDVASAYGIEPRRPHLDKRLVEFCLALPLNQLMRSGWSKYIVRNAMNQYMPEAICWRRGKTDLAEPFVSTRFQLEQNEISRKISGYPGNLQKYVDMDRVQNQIEESTESNIIGNIPLWNLYALIMWLQARARTEK